MSAPLVHALVVEAETALRSSLCRSIAAAGWAFTSCRDPAEAWPLILAHHPHAVLVRMGRGDGDPGAALVGRIRALPAGIAPLAIALWEPDPAAPDAGPILASGVDDAIVLPPSPVDVACRLRAAQGLIALRAQVEHAARRMERDLDAARRVQRALLPSPTLAVAGLDLAWVVEPCEQVGGDALDIYRLDETRVGFHLLDVSGHGVAAALLAVQATRALRPDTGAGGLVKRPSTGPPWYRLPDPEEVLRDLARMFPPDPDRPRFMTLVYGVLDLATWRVRLGRAGLAGPSVVGPGARWRCAEPSHPVGLFAADELMLDLRSVELAPGTSLILHSDGIGEAGGDRPLGDAEVLRIIPEPATAGEQLAAIIAAVHRHDPDPPRDDRAVLILRRPPA